MITNKHFWLVVYTETDKCINYSFVILNCGIYCGGPKCLFYLRGFFKKTDDQVTMHTDWRAFEVIINRTFQSQAEKEEGSPSILSKSLDAHTTIAAFSVSTVSLIK